MSAIAPPPVPPDRSNLPAERCKRSVVWRIIYLLGSLGLALILLATIAIACAVATFAESGFNTKIAHAYIYKAPWFQLWLGVLCVNLFAVTLTRWPWKKRHIGFVITHYGIITLLIGAVVGMRTGFEGNVTLRKDEPSLSRVTTSHSILQLDSPNDLDAFYQTSFDAEATRPSAKHPRIFPVPRTDLKIVADDFNANLQREETLVPSTAQQAGAGVLLKLSSKTSGPIPILVSLTEGQQHEADFFGLARIHLEPELPPVKMEVPRETQMVFAKFASVVQASGRPSGLEIHLNEDGSKLTVVLPDGTGAEYPREQIMNRPVAEHGFLITLEKYWPDFVMKNGEPGTQSDTPKNPAALVRVTPVPDPKPVLEMAASPDGMAYQLRRNGEVYSSGNAKAGDLVHLGWADWEADFAQISPKATVAVDMKPGPELPKGEQGIPGFRAHLVSADGRSGPPRWIGSGQLVPLTEGKNTVNVGYGLEIKPLPFAMRLVNFSVPRDEGTDTPSNFLATVEFNDVKTGVKKTGVAQMNRPASFPGTLWANLTGLNYKFSQAQWNPQNLNETTLQVLYDPGWLLKWLGSLAIVIGIAIMFYWKPTARD